MNEITVLDIGRDGVWTMVTTVGPILLIGLSVGLTVSLFQTLTHIQEMTLTFIPKIIATFLGLLFLLPYMITNLREFYLRMMDQVISLS